MGSPHNI